MNQIGIKKTKHTDILSVAIQSILQHHSHISFTSHSFTRLIEPQSIPQWSHRDSLHFDIGDLQPVLCARWEGITFSIQLFSCTLLCCFMYTKIEHKYSQRLTNILCATWTWTQTEPKIEGNICTHTYKQTQYSKSARLKDMQSRIRITIMVIIYFYSAKHKVCYVFVVFNSIHFCLQFSWKSLDKP